MEVSLTEVVVPSADESVMASDSGRQLAELLQTHTIRAGNYGMCIGISGEEVALPLSAARLLVHLLRQMDERYAVMLLPT
jgi:hypothetical protein